MRTERTECPLCTTKAEFHHTDTYTDPKDGTVYDLFYCTQCSGGFWEPLQNPGGTWYEHDERYADRNQNPILNPNWNHLKIISYLSPKTGKVLDVGCGVGNFLAYAVSHGWTGAGIDFDRDAIEAGTRTFGLSTLSVSDIHTHTASHTASEYDLVTFFDVLEHIDDHDAFMGDVRTLLKDGGHIALSVPYGDHATFLMPADVPPRHLTRWNEKSIGKFLKRFNFDVVYTKKTAASIRFIILKLRFRFGGKFSVGLVQKMKTAPGGEKSKAGAVRIASGLASLKDAVLFGLPALIIWVFLLSTQKRYIGLYVIAKKRT